jgi:hypothetical protein
MDEGRRAGGRLWRRLGPRQRNTTVGFTGDLVTLDGKDEAKEGRRNIPSKRLKIVPFPAE